MNNSGIEIFKNEDEKTQVQVVLENETVLLNLNQMVSQFKRDKSVIWRHIKNVVKEEKLERNSVIAKIATTAKEGKSYQVKYFNLDIIVSVGCRINSKRGMQFRIRESKILENYLIQVYSLNEQKIIQPYRQLQKQIA